MAKKKNPPPSGNEEKPSRGRPTDYKPEYCDMLLEHFKKGKSYVAFASFLGVARSTLYEWEQNHPEYSDTKKVGWEHYQTWWEEQGQEGLYNQTFMEPDGSKRSVSLNTAVWLYNMKCRFREDWFDERDRKKDAEEKPDDETELKELMAWYREVKELK